MSEMRERVAVAIAARLDGMGCDCGRDFVRMGIARELASLAIEAMREPTDDVITAMGGTRADNRAIAFSFWQAGFDQALGVFDEVAN